VARRVARLAHLWPTPDECASHVVDVVGKDQVQPCGVHHDEVVTDTARAGVARSSDVAKAEQIAVEWSRSIGVTGEGAAALKQLRALPAEKFIEGASAKEGIAALSEGKILPGMAWAIIDGRFLTETAEATLAAGRQDKVPVILGSNDRDIGLGTARMNCSPYSDPTQPGRENSMIREAIRHSKNCWSRFSWTTR